MEAGRFAVALQSLKATLAICDRVLNSGETSPELQISAELRVESFGFGVIFFQQFLNAAPLLLTNEGFHTALDVAKLIFGENGLLDLFKLTKGAPPSTVAASNEERGIANTGEVHGDQKVDNSTTVNNYNTNIYLPSNMQPGAWELYKRNDIRNHVQGIIEPFEDEGSERVNFRTQDGDGTDVFAAQARMYRLQRDPEFDREAFLTYEDTLTIVKQSFDDSRRWVFESMGGTFGAIMGDVNFRTRVHRREEPILDGDRIRALIAMKTYAPARGKQRSPEYFIREVLEVIHPDRPIRGNPPRDSRLF